MKDIVKILLATLPIYILIGVIIWFIFGGDKFTKQDMMNELNQRDSTISQMIKIVGDQQKLVIDHTNRQYTPFVLNNSNDEQFVKLRDELKDLNIKMKNLNSSYELAITAFGVGKTEIVKVHDTLDLYTFKDSSAHLTLDGKVDTKSGMMEYNYEYNANYSLYSYKYKKSFFKRPELRLKITSDDPNNKISAKTFTVKPPREIVSIGVGVGGSMIYIDNKVKFAPSITLGVYKSLYTFRTKR